MGSAAYDRFEDYFTEKLWTMIPSVYRQQDGKHGPLRAIVSILGQQGAILRRSQDRVWDDQFIDLCDGWAIPYLADLLATRLTAISEIASHARRVDVAKTVYYRRRKGTVRVLEELIFDIAQWDGRVIEQYRRLGRTFHSLDPRPGTRSGRITGTAPGGWADLRSARGAELSAGPFDEFHHTADVRRHRGIVGRYAIPKLAFHLYRLAAYRLDGVTASRAGRPRRYTIDPSGRDVPLFSARRRLSTWDRWTAAQPWQLPAPINCRVLNHAEYRIDSGRLKQVLTEPGGNLTQSARCLLDRLAGRRFLGEQRLRDTLGAYPGGASLLGLSRFNTILSHSFTEDCGKYNLIGQSIRVDESGVTVPSHEIVAGDLSDWDGSIPVATLETLGKRLVIDPERGRLLFLGSTPALPVTVLYYYAFSAPVGAGGHDRGELDAPDTLLSNGGALTQDRITDGEVTEIEDSGTYVYLANKLSISKVTLQAAQNERPYLELGTNWVLDSGANKDALLKLDGLWIGGGHDLILRGDFKEVRIRHCTLDPGDADGIFATRLIVEGRIQELIIESSVAGRVLTRGDGALVEKLRVEDSIVQELDPSVNAIDLPETRVAMQRVSIFGGVRAEGLYASELLATGVVNVTDTQASSGIHDRSCKGSCFRFSAAAKGSRLPRAYESHEFKDSAHFFVSRRYGRPGYAQLSESAPLFLRRGAENGSEIGAFSKQHGPIRRDSLQTKIEEFMPFGLTPILISQT